MMCIHMQTFYACTCPPPLLAIIPCPDPLHCVNTVKHEKRVFRVCLGCIEMRNRFRYSACFWDNRFTKIDLGGKGLPDGRRVKRPETDTRLWMTKDAAMDGRPKRKRMLTLEEMLNPVDEKQAPREPEDVVPHLGPSESLDEEVSKTLGEGEDERRKKPRVAREIRHRVEGRGKRTKSSSLFHG